MMLLALALLLQHEAHTSKGDPKLPRPSRIEIQGRAKVEIPKVQHFHKVSVADLAPATIAFCERNGKTRCINEVSAFSGGSKITVCKVSGKWLINQCGKTK